MRPMPTGARYLSRMYAHCLFCSVALGTNEAIGHFPVGRRLAFDSGTGRLWVVCKHCGRWCLSPLDERWEAVEEAERLFRDTRTRYSTEQIGIARVADGTELVRIGRPLRPEFAAWRYGDLFHRRMWRSAVAPVVASTGLLASVVAGFAYPAAWLITGGSIAQVAHLGFEQWRRRLQTVARVEGVTTTPLRLSRRNVGRSRLLADRDHGWALQLTFPSVDSRMRLRSEAAIIRGDDARRVLSRILPANNAEYGGRRHVRDAVQILEGSPGFAAKVPGVIDRAMHRGQPTDDPDIGSFASLAPDVRLALEMAVHEEDERRALEGELAELERSWQEAEAIASIADNLLLPKSVRTTFERLTRTRMPPPLDVHEH